MLPTDKQQLFETSTKFDFQSKSKSSEKISSHSIEKKSKDNLINNINIAYPKIFQKLNKKKPGPISSATYSKDFIAKKQGIQTPVFSKHSEIENQDINVPKNNFLKDKAQISNKEVYKYLESIKIPIKEEKTQFKCLREQLEKLKSNTAIQQEIQMIENILIHIQNKLNHSKIDKVIEEKSIIDNKASRKISLTEISPIKKQNPLEFSNTVLFTTLNLESLSDTPQELKMDENSSQFNQIEYYKIMHMLGQNIQITPKKSQKSTTILEKIKESKINKQKILHDQYHENGNIPQIHLKLEAVEKSVKISNNSSKLINSQKIVRKQSKQNYPKKKSLAATQQKQIHAAPWKKKSSSNNIHY